MTDLDTSIRYIEQLSDEEWGELHKATKTCSEIGYCLRSCAEKCATAELLRLLKKKASRGKVLKFLLEITEEKRDELGNKPIYCLEQGFCALYCISSCPTGKFIRTLTRERPLDQSGASNLYSNISS